MRRTRQQVDLEATEAHVRQNVGIILRASDERLRRADPDLTTAEGQSLAELLVGIAAALGAEEKDEDGEGE